MLRTQALVSLLAYLVFAGSARGDDLKNGDDVERWMSYPRLQEVWQRAGVGGRRGVAGPDTYYTLTDDGKAVVALDAATGRDRWRHQLSEPVEDDSRGSFQDGWLGGDDLPLALHGTDLLVATQRRHETAVHLTSLDTRTGRMLWSRVVECGHFLIVPSAAGWVFQCRPDWLDKARTVFVLSTTNGSERARASVMGRVAVGPGGEICTAGTDRIGCSRFQGGRLVPRWSRSVPPVRFAHVLATPGWVVFLGDLIRVFRLSDGRPTFQHPRPSWMQVDTRHERLFLFGAGEGEVVRLRDGALSKLPWLSDDRPRLLHGERASVLTRPWGRGSLGVVDGRGELQSIESRGVDIDDLVGNTALARTYQVDGRHRVGGDLHGYSLVQFAPPAVALDEYGQTVAMLEHCGWDFRDIEDALVAVRRLPHGMDRLEQAISIEKGWTQIRAIEVAAASRSTRYLAVLRRLLGRLSLQPKARTEEVVLLETLATMAEMETLQAAEDLFAFWQKSEGHIPSRHLRLEVQQRISRAVWRHSAGRDWELCPTRSFPVSPASPDAVLGTGGPTEPALADDRRRWAVICQARQDDNGDGELRVQTLEHGGTTGDVLRPYLVLGSGPGTEVDDAMAGPKGDHLVVTLGTCLYDVDTRTGKASVLGHADGRTRPGADFDHPAAAFSRDNSHLAYWRSQPGHAWLVVRNLESGREHTADLGLARVGGMRVDSAARTVSLEMAEPPPPDASWTEWSVRGPREAVCHRHDNLDGRLRLGLPKPVFHSRVWPMAGGALGDGPENETFTPSSRGDAIFISPSDLLEPVKQTGSPPPSRIDFDHLHDLPSGPLRWRSAESTR